MTTLGIYEDERWPWYGLCKPDGGRWERTVVVSDATARRLARLQKATEVYQRTLERLYVDEIATLT